MGFVNHGTWKLSPRNLVLQQIGKKKAVHFFIFLSFVFRGVFFVFKENIFFLYNLSPANQFSRSNTLVIFIAFYSVLRFSNNWKLMTGAPHAGARLGCFYNVKVFARRQQQWQQCKRCKDYTNTSGFPRKQPS